MQALIYDALEQFSTREIGRPTPSAGEVLIRTRASGVCHTDIDILHGRYGSSTFPLVPGHEYAGTVEALGEGVDDLAVGDRVVVDPNLSCGHCRACLRGLGNLCASLGAYGVTVNGGFAEFGVVRRSSVHPIGELPFDVAALAEPLGCVLNGIEVSGIDGMRDALVFGCGPIGLLMGLALHARGLEDVAVVDLAEGRLAFAESLGLTPLAAGSDELAKYRRARDLVVDATGVTTVVEGLVGYTADGGTALVFGVGKPEAQISLSPHEIFRRQIRFAGAHSLNHNIPEALAMLHTSRETMSRVVSHRLPLDEIGPFLSKSGSGDSLKVQFDASA